MTSEFRTISTAQTLPFRQAMLWPDRPITHVMVPGDDTALHLGAYDGPKLIAVGSFYPDATQARLRKLAVMPAYRGSGLGSNLVLHGVGLMRDKGLQQLWCDARYSARGFYDRLGFTISDDVFEKSGIAYVLARLEL